MRALRTDVTNQAAVTLNRTRRREAAARSFAISPESKREYLSGHER